MAREVGDGEARGGAARTRHRPHDGLWLVLRRARRAAHERRLARGRAGTPGAGTHLREARARTGQGLHARPLLAPGDVRLPEGVRGAGRKAPRVLPRFLGVLRGGLDAAPLRGVQGPARLRPRTPVAGACGDGAGAGAAETAPRLPRDARRACRGDVRRVGGLVPCARHPHAQRGARRARELARPLRARRHPGDGDVRRLPRRPCLEIRLLGGAREGHAPRLGRKLHVDRRALPRASGGRSSVFWTCSSSRASTTSSTKAAAIRPRRRPGRAGASTPRWR